MNREQGFMSELLFDSLVSQIGKYMINTMFYFQGESMLHPRFFEFLEKSRSMGVIISTNGHFIDRDNAKRLMSSGARKIIISMDGFTQESYSKYRVGGNLDLVKEGIKQMARAKKGIKVSPVIELQVLVNKYNGDEISAIRKFAKMQGVKLKLKSMQISGKNDTEGFLPAGRRFNRYKTENGELIRRGRFSNRCFRLWTNPVITWDGRVVPCCFDKRADYVMGDLNESSFSDIWRSNKYGDFRKKVLKARKSIPICLNCTS